ncbi:MAG: ribosome-associated translation inhibitor RaiA [Tissierellia bacterium]|nr:ribosome-associated translation inhibitor RaiA [Tissierellia bacterium]
MLLEFVGKNIELTDALKNQAEKKLSKLDRYFNEEIEGKITFSTQKGNRTAEVTIYLPGTILRSEETTADMYASIDKAVDVLERQVRKYKTRLKKRYQNTETIRFENFEQSIPEKGDETADPQIIKRKKFDLKPMNVEEAILQMELLNHNFFVFLDGDTGRVSVLYKREDGNYGQIEVESA